MTTTRVLVAGSRNWEDRALIRHILTSFHWMHAGDDITLVSGYYETGADRMCESVAAELGWSIERHPAAWDLYGKRAGFFRNKEMVDRGADVCLAFILDDSKGATMTANLAEKAGIETLRYKRYTSDNGVPKGVAVATRVPEQRDPDVLQSVDRIEGRNRVPAIPGDHG